MACRRYLGGVMIRGEGGTLGRLRPGWGASLYMFYCLEEDEGMNLARVSETRKEGTDTI